MPSVKQRAGKTTVGLYQAEINACVKAAEVMAFVGSVGMNERAAKCAGEIRSILAELVPPVPPATEPKPEPKTAPA